MEHIDIKIEVPWSDKDDITHLDMVKSETDNVDIKPELYQYGCVREVKNELFTKTKGETVAVKIENENDSCISEYSKETSVVKGINSNNNLPTLKSKCQSTTKIENKSILRTSNLNLEDVKSEQKCEVLYGALSTNVRIQETPLKIENASSNNVSSHNLISSHTLNGLNMNGFKTLKNIYPQIEFDTAGTEYNDLEINGAINQGPYETPETSDMLKNLEHNNNTIQSELTLKSQNKYECNTCGKAFSCPSKLINHIRCHTGERPYKCTKCDKAFAQKGYMLNHLRRSHTESKPFKCTECNKVFSKKPYMLVHLKRHSSSESFKCTQCPKSYFRERGLIKHTMTCTGPKPFKCTVCGKAFADKRDMLKHLKRSHTESKPLICTLCDQSWLTKIGLIIHTRSCTGPQLTKRHKCTVCDKAFHRKDGLINHTRTHTGSKPFKCIVCDKCFSEKGSLRRHTRIHTGSKADTDDPSPMS